MIYRWCVFYIDVGLYWSAKTFWLEKIGQKQTMVDIPKWGVKFPYFSIVFLQTNGGKSWKVAFFRLLKMTTAVQVHPEGSLWAPRRGGSAGRRTAALEGARPRLGLGYGLRVV